MRPRGPDVCDFRIALFALFLVAGPARLVGAWLGEQSAMEAAFLAKGKDKLHVKQAAQLRPHVSHDLEKMLLRDRQEYMYSPSPAIMSETSQPLHTISTSS